MSFWIFFAFLVGMAVGLLICLVAFAVFKDED